MFNGNVSTMKFAHLSAILLLSAVPGLAAANELLNVYRLALENDADYAAARYARDAALEARPQARAALLPWIDGSYTYGRGRSEGRQLQRFETSSDGDAEPVPFVSDRRFDTDDTERTLSVNLTQPLFDWAAFQRYAKSADTLALAQANFRSAQQRLLYRSAQAYFDYLAAHDDVRLTTAQKRSFERQLEQSKGRFEQGSVAQTEVQESQASYDISVAAAIAAEQALDSAREALLVITGQQDAALQPLQEQMPLPGPQPANIDEWLASARDNNYELAIARLGVALADHDTAIARAGHLPTLGLSGGYVDRRLESDERRAAFGGLIDELQGPSVALQVRLPIFSGGLVQSQLREAASIAGQRQAQWRGVERGVTLLTRDAYRGVLAGSARVKALEQAVHSSQISLEAIQAGLELGTRTAIDVLTSQSLLFQAQRDHARARYEYLLSVLGLKAAAGRLTEADLAEVDALLSGGPQE